MLRGPSSQNHDPAVILRRPPPPLRRARVSRPPPQLPSEPGIKIREAGGKAPKLVAPTNELADLSHDGGGVTLPLMLERRSDALDIAGSKRPLFGRQKPFNDCGMRDDAATLYGENVQPAYRVVPVVVSKAVLKGLVQQLTKRLQSCFGKLMSGQNPYIDHKLTPRRTRSCGHEMTI